MDISKSRLSVKALVMLALVFTLMLGVEDTKAHEHSGYSHDSGIGYTNTNWMGTLPDGMKLSTLSIPGTHDTMAYQFSTSCDIITDIVRTQTMDLETQLNSGIRVLDIRLRHAADNAFALHHGSCFLDSYFGGDVMDVVNNFLDANPSETILMRVKKEHNDAENLTMSFHQTWNWYMGIYGSKVWQGSGNPTLGEVRGKIVILDQSAGVSYGLNWSSLEIQDNYDMATNWDLYGKWEDVKQHLIDAAAGDKDDFYVNFLSAANGGFPYFFASGHSNPATGAPRLSTGHTTATCGSDCYPDFPRTSCLGDWCTVSFEGTNILTTNLLSAYSAIGTKQRVGIIMSDFPGAGLISNIIAMNPWNSPPVANAGGAYVANEGATIVFDAGASTDPDGDALSFRWDFDSDGTYDTPSSSSGSASYALQDNWSGTATVEVSDGYSVSTATTLVTVNNVAPTLTLSGMTINENGTATVSGVLTDPGTLDTFTVGIDWGNGETGTATLPVGTTNFSFSHQYLDDAPTGTASDTYTVEVTVTDDDGGSGSNTSLVTVNNVAPTASFDTVIDGAGNLIGDVPPNDLDIVLEGLELSISVSFADVGTLDTHTATIDWDDGSSWKGPATGSIVASHTYSTADSYTITVTIVDDDTGQVSVSRVVEVVDAAGAVEDLVEDLQAMLTDPAIDPALAASIRSALNELEGMDGESSEDGALDKIDRRAWNAALVKLQNAAVILEDAGLHTSASQVVLTAKSIVVGLINQAESSSRRARIDRAIVEAGQHVAHGDAATNAGTAIEFYQRALVAIRPAPAGGE